MVLSLLLSYGADPRIAEKHGATAEQIAAQNGFLEAADLLHSYSLKLDQAAILYEEEHPDEAGSVSGSSRSGHARHRTGGSSLRSLGGLRRKHSSRHRHELEPMQVQAQRSFDALATKFAHHAHRAASSSSTSVNSLRGLTPFASSSQISLGATDTSLLAATAATTGLAQARRRPSLPGSAAVRPALSGSADSLRVRSSTIGSGPTPRQIATVGTWRTAEPGGSASPHEDAELAERRRSMEVNRPLRQDSMQSGLPTLASLDLSARTLGGRRSMDDPDPTPTETRASTALGGPVSPTRPGPPQRFYRPRQSSALSKGSFTGRRPSIDEDDEHAERVFEDESPPPGLATADAPRPNRPRAVSNPDSRSPLQQQLHATQYRPPRSRESSANNESPTAARAAALAATTLAVPATNPSSGDTRARSNSASTDASYTVSSSSHESTWSGPTFSTASTSTAPTTAPPHSPSKRIRAPVPDVGGYFKQPLDLTNRRQLGPLYEANSPGITLGPRSAPRDDPAPTNGDQSERSRARSGKDMDALGVLTTQAIATRADGGPNVKNLKEQLAAYGKTLRAERELEANRHGKAATGGYTFETISTSASKGEHARHSLDARIVPLTFHATAVRNAASPSAATKGRSSLLPPSPTRSRRSHSPGSTIQQQRSPRQGDSLTLLASGSSSAAAALPVTGPTAKTRALESTRAASPTSTRSGSKDSAAAAPEATEAPVLGQGPGGVSFVSVQPPPQSRHLHHAQHYGHHHHHQLPHGNGGSHSRNGSKTTRSSDQSQSDRDLASVNSGGAISNAPVSTRKEVEEERRRREEEEQKVPKAMRTVPGRSGFSVRKLFGSGAK